MLNCLFCELDKDPDQEIIFKNDLAIYTQNKKYQGSLKYSGVIIPIAHKETVFDLTQEEILACFELLHRVKEFIDAKYNPGGYNIGWNNGAVGGQHIFHAHMHVIPRFECEPLAGKGIRAYLASEENRW